MTFWIFKLFPLLQFGLFATIAWSLWSVVKNFKSQPLPGRIFFLLQVLIWVFLAVLRHPGFVSFDNFQLQKILLQGALSAWSGIMYSLFVKSFFEIDHSLFLVCLFQIYLFLGCIWICLKIFPLRSWWIAGLLTLLTMHPLIHIVNLFITRDTLFGLLSCVLVLQIGQRYLLKQTLTLRFLIMISFMVFVIAQLRQEAIIYVLAFPALVFGFRSELGIKGKSLICILLVGFSALWIFLLNNDNKVQINQDYQLTGVLHSLNYIVHSNPQGISSDQKQKIAAVVDYDSLVNEYNENSISQFHERKFKLPVSDEIWSNFLSVYRELVVENKELFLKERTQVFMTTLNIEGVGYLYSDEFDAQMFEKDRKLMNMESWKLFPELTRFHQHYLGLIYSFISVNPTINALSPISPVELFVLSWFVLWLLRKSDFAYFYLGASVFCYSRLPAVFLLAPEPQLKYYNILIYLPFFLTLLGVLALQKKVELGNVH